MSGIFTNQYCQTDIGEHYSAGYLEQDSTSQRSCENQVSLLKPTQDQRGCINRHMIFIHNLIGRLQLLSSILWMHISMYQQLWHENWEWWSLCLWRVPTLWRDTNIVTTWQCQNATKLLISRDQQALADQRRFYWTLSSTTEPCWTQSCTLAQDAHWSTNELGWSTWQVVVSMLTIPDTSPQYHS